jgi:hypothetical protein
VAQVYEFGAAAEQQSHSLEQRHNHSASFATFVIRTYEECHLSDAYAPAAAVCVDGRSHCLRECSTTCHAEFASEKVFTREFVSGLNSGDAHLTT